MKSFTVSVRKLTDVELLREACQTTFLGTSHASLSQLYRSEHSPVRTQLFWVKLEGIPLYVSTHLIRHHVGSQPVQLTCRDDRKGGNPGLPAKVDEIKSDISELLEHFHKGGMYTGEHHAKLSEILYRLDWLKENTDRQTPVNLGLCINAQSLIDMAKVRLCKQASPETRLVFGAIKAEIAKIDSDLAKFMVPKCIYGNGLCRETKCCGYNSTPEFQNELSKYLDCFTEKQRGIAHNVDGTYDSSRMAQQ